MDFSSKKICHEKHWVESSLKNKGNYYREFLVTKRGYEFLEYKRVDNFVRDTRNYINIILTNEYLSWLIICNIKTDSRTF